MRYIYTSEQAKAIDTHAIGTLGFPGLVLMEKAAMALAAVIMEKETPDRTILCVCGMGNNGGDGVAVSRILRQAGFTTAVCPVRPGKNVAGYEKANGTGTFLSCAGCKDRGNS